MTEEYEYQQSYNQKSINVEDRHKEFLAEQDNFNFSGFIRAKLDEYIEEQED